MAHLRKPRRKLCRTGRYVRMPRIPRGRRAPLAFVSVAIVMTLSACGGTIPDTASHQSASPTPQSRHEPANAKDTALARSLLLRPSELPSGWTLFSQDDYTAADLSTHFCLSHYPGYVAGSSVDYGFHLDPKGQGGQGQLGMDIRITNSEADAQTQLQLLRSPDANTTTAAQCVLEGYQTSIGRSVGFPNLLPGAELLPASTPPGSLPGITMRAKVPYRLFNANKIMYVDDIRIQKGRIVARFFFMTCCEAFDYASDEAPAVDAVARRMAEASVTSTT
jgi:hypothetical protein